MISNAMKRMNFIHLLIAECPCRLAVRPFLTREFFQEILGLEGSKIYWEKKPVSYEEIFRQNFLAQNFLRKFWLEFS